MEEFRILRQEINECMNISSNISLIQLEILRKAAPGVSDNNLLKFFDFKNDVQRTVKLIKDHKTWRLENSWIDNPPLRAHSDILLRKILESGMVVQPQEMVDKCEQPCMLLRPHLNDMSDGRTPHDICRAVLYSIERLLQRPDVRQKGVALLYDLRGIEHNSMHTEVPATILKALSGGKIPIRVKAFYFLNPPWFFRPAFSILWCFLSEKLRRRVHFIDKIEALNTVIETEKLLEEYGGNMKHDHTQWLQQQIHEELHGDLDLMEAFIHT